MNQKIRLITIVLMITVAFPAIISIKADQTTNTSTIISSLSTSVQTNLTRVPEEVYAWQPALILAEVRGDFATMRLNTAIQVHVRIEYVPKIVLPPPPEETDLPLLVKSLRLAPTGNPGWYATSIPGLPAGSFNGTSPLGGTYNVTISSSVSYDLVIDGVVKGNGSYAVRGADGVSDFPPMVVAMSYDVLEEPDLLNETMGLGPKGWTVSQDDAFDILVLAFDEYGLNETTCKYRTKNNQSWIPLETKEDPLMFEIKGLFDDVDGTAQQIMDWIENHRWVRKRLDIGHGYPSFGVFNATIEAPQSLGEFIMFRASATDVNGSSFTSPMGLYYTTNGTSSTRVLIVDPWVKLWLLNEDVQLLINSSRIAQNYGMPPNFKEELFSRSRIAAALKENGLIPFHHWELLGKHYNLSIAWAGDNLVNLLKNQSEGGFEPHVIVLSNLRFGLNVTGDSSFWNWDLNDIKVNGETVQQVLINYVKQHHAGLIATRGTLSDWVVWLGPESSQHYKVGARGHVGNSIKDLDVINEKTIASMLGMPQIALWEYLRDQVAKALAAELVGLAVGSLPLQIPFVPLNSSLDATTVGAGHPVLDGVDLPFDLPVQSVYSEFGFNSHTQVGWQLAMARHIAYDAWTKSNKTLPLANETINRFTQLIENVTNSRVSSGNASSIRESLRWALGRIYSSIISASISGTTFNATFDFHELNLPQPKTIARNIDFTKLLQLLPVKLIASSENYTAGIVTHDKYWDENGYRSVYFSVEPEACNETVAETLLKNAVNWTNASAWEYRDITTLLGDQVRVPNDLADAFQNAVDNLPGDVTFSNSIVLVEEGKTMITVNASKAGFLHLLIAHPTSGKVNLTVIEGAEVYQLTNVTNRLSYITLEIREAGTVKLSIKANPESSLNPAYLSVKQDVTPPSTTISLSGVAGDNGWFTSDVTVTLSATDDTEVDKIEYSFDNATWITYTAPFTVTDEGYVKVYYKSTDKAGNVETIKTETIKIDKTAPAGTIIINNGDTYTTSTSVTLTLTSTDATSGVRQVRFSNDGVWDTKPWELFSTTKEWTLTPSDGTKTVYYQIKDNAGLISTTFSDTIILDTDPPTADAGVYQTVNEDTEVTFDGSASQDENGIASYTWTFTDITPQTLSGKNPTYTFNTPGVYTITLNVTDAAGNWATDTVVITVLDITKPVANAGQNQTVNVGETVNFDAGASSDNVGIVSYEWNFGDGTTGTGKTTTHTYADPRTYTVTLTVKDSAGNTATHAITITVLAREAFLIWVIGAATAITAVVIAIAATILWKRRK